MTHPHRRKRRRKHVNKITFNGGMDAPRRGMLFAQRAAVQQTVREAKVKLAHAVPTRSADGETAQD